MLYIVMFLYPKASWIAGVMISCGRKRQEDWAGARYSAAQCSCGLWSPYFFDVTYDE